MMKQAVPALFCAVLFATNIGAAVADPAFDRDVASRYMQAAQSGDDDAEFYLGALYSAGVGLPASDAEAFRWFSRAADQGHAHAMLVLAGLYAVGRGTEKDNVKAYKWASIVAAGSKIDEFRNGARQLMGVLEAKMAPEEINLAKANATNWHAVTNSGQARVNAAPPSQANPPPPPSAPPAASTTSAPPSMPQAQTSVVNPSPAPRAATETTELRSGKGAKKEDIDNLLDQVPQGLRKRFGF